MKSLAWSAVALAIFVVGPWLIMQGLIYWFDQFDRWISS